MFLNRFSSDLKYSGHSCSFRQTVLRRVVEKYESDLSNHQEGIKTMYRTGQERITMNEERKVSAQRDTWFRSDGFTSTLTVPATQDGSLVDRIRRNLDQGRQPPGTKTKVIEGGGVSARSGLVRSNPFPRKTCERESCLLCFQEAGKVAMCDRSNVGYSGECSRCPTKFAYIGETSRTGYTRLKEHMSNYRAASASSEQRQPEGKKVKSWMWEHVRDCHSGVVGENGGMEDFKVKVSGSFSKCLQRQVDEDIRMQEYEANGGILLNSKYEYYTPKSVQTIFHQF